MKPGKNFYKDEIKKRIAEVFPHAKDDPVINIFTEACAAEFAEIKDELDEFKSNFIHELSKSFARGLIFGPKPAHALLTCLPNTNSIKVPAFSKFEFPLSNPFFSDLSSIAFSTVTDHEVFNRDIKILHDKEFWLILQIHGQAFSIDELAGANEFLFYIALKGSQDVVHQHDLLLSALTKCQVDVFLKNPPEKPAKLKSDDNDNQNAHSGKSEDTEGVTEPINSDENKQNDKKGKDKEKYQKFDGKLGRVNYSNRTDRFQQINKSFLTSASEDFLETALSYYANSFLNFSVIQNKNTDPTSEELPDFETYSFNIDSRYVLIKIDHQPLLEIGIHPEDIEIKLNCFPVFNLERQILNTQIINNYVEPINLVMPDAESSFFGLQSIKENFSHKGETGVTDVLKERPQNFSLYTSDFNRLSYEDADELVNKLIMKYSSEPLAFEKYKDVIEGLKSKLKYKSFKLPVRKSTIVDNDPIYLFYKPEPEHSGIVEVKYLTTKGQKANGLKKESLKELSNTLDGETGNPLEIKSDECYLISTTIGGRDELNDVEKNYEFWNVFYSKGSIITMEDVRNYCYHFFGNAINNISIRKRYLHDTSVQFRGNVIIEIAITIKVSELIHNEKIEVYNKEALLLQHILNNKSHAALNVFTVKIDFDFYSTKKAAQWGAKQ